MLETFAEVTRISMYEAMDKVADEFLFFNAYAKAKNKQRENEIKKAQRRVRK